MDQSFDYDDRDNDDCDLQSLLLQEPIDSWGPIYRRIETHPQEAQGRYYRNESPLQLALKAKEARWEANPSVINDITLDREDSIFPTKTAHATSRMQVLEALIVVNPDAIIWRDDEGRTPLHTACSAGRSFEILRWLLKQEKTWRVGKYLANGTSFDDIGDIKEENALFRTDFPGGALALHSIAACSVFDDLYFRTMGQLTEGETTVDDETYSKCLEQFQRCPFPVEITPNILAAYASTTTIIKANPNAIWEKDCEGEIPLHCAASWGNIGTVLALLIGVIDCEEPMDKIIGSGSAVTSAALILNDRNKNSLDCACERVVAFSIHGNGASRSITTSHLENRRDNLSGVSERIRWRDGIVREDPFDVSGTGRSQISARRNMPSRNEVRGSALRTSISTGGRQRIPGCKSSFRSSFSSSFVLSGGLFGLDDDQLHSDAFRSSFTSRRRPVHPLLGVALDEDGDEEFAKVELLAWAACDRCNYKRDQGDREPFMQILHINASDVEGNRPEQLDRSRSDSFHLVHEVIKLGCPPEVVWHAARKYPVEVITKDALDRVPLSLACERLVRSLTVVKEEMKPQGCSMSHVTAFSKGFDLAYDRNKLENFNAGRTYVESFCLAASNSSPDIPAIESSSSIYSARHEEVSPLERDISSTSSSRTLPPTTEDSTNSKTLAPEQQYLFAIEIINMLLYSPVFGSKEMASTRNKERRLPLHITLEAVPWIDVREEGDNPTREQTKLVRSLIDAYPRALESRDGKTGLYPFMLAAAPANKWPNGNDYEHNCLSRVETVYHLLLENPAVISLCLQNDISGTTGCG